jgi:thioredoxin-like negative regulator of GroEL
MCVTEILGDLGEMVDRAARGEASRPGSVRVTVTEREGSPRGHPSYAVAFKLGPRRLETPLTVDTIWAGETYSGIAQQLLKTCGLSPRAAEARGDAEGVAMLERLLDARPDTLEQESQRISGLLSKDMLDAGAHEQAAFILGALALRENAWAFSDTRLELCRQTAHLSMALALKEGRRSDIGAGARILSALGMNRQTEALQLLGNWPAGPEPARAAWSRVLRVTANGDYRVFPNVVEVRPLERIAWFKAYARHANVTTAFNHLLRGELLEHQDYHRITRAHGAGVEVGHELFANALRGEFQEQQQVSKAYGAIPGEDLTALNAEPEHLIATNGEVRVVGWGTWASFFQRHLCLELLGQYNFLSRSYGAPEEAAEVASQIRSRFRELLLQPFVLMRMPTNAYPHSNPYERAIQLSQSHPRRVPPHSWGEFDNLPTSGSHRLRNAITTARAAWLRHYPLPGTALVLAEGGIEWRSVGQNSSLSEVEALRQLAPYDLGLLAVYRNLATRPKNPFEEPPPLSAAMVQSLWGPLDGYSLGPMYQLAGLVRDDPPEYERRMLQLASVDTHYYVHLADYLEQRGDAARALPYLAKAWREMPDRVSAASQAIRLVNLYMDAGQMDKAAEVAAESSDVYSHIGLLSKAIYHERRGELTEAHAWLLRIEERYNSTHDLAAFCVRNAPKVIGKPEEKLLLGTLDRLRPKNLLPASLADFKEPPRIGARFTSTTHSMQKYGLKYGDVIVALNGFRIRTARDYTALRDTQIKPELKLIVWDGTNYREVQPDLKDNRFGAYIENYKP